MPHFAALWFVLVLFAVLSLGPVLHVWGVVVPAIRLPYAALGRLLPPLRMSGCPIRMTVFVALAAGLLIPVQVERMVSRRTGGAVTWRGFGAAALLALLIVEFLPKPIPTVNPPVPAWVNVLAAQSKRYALYDIDNLQGESAALDYQTRHQVPMVGGYISRVPVAVARRDRVLSELARAGKLRTLCENYGVGYVLARPLADPPPRPVQRRPRGALRPDESLDVPHGGELKCAPGSRSLPLGRPHCTNELDGARARATARRQTQVPRTTRKTMRRSVGRRWRGSPMSMKHVRSIV
jgi:hypothetical protein